MIITIRIDTEDPEVVRLLAAKDHKALLKISSDWHAQGAEILKAAKELEARACDIWESKIPPHQRRHQTPNHE